MRWFNVEGKVAVVTGASGGLGTAIAQGLVEAGSRVVGADLQLPSWSESDYLRFVQTDVSQETQVEALVRAACSWHGRIDLMVANAAIPGGGRAETESAESWERVMAVNARGVFLCDRAAARPMREQGGGCIVNIASVLSFIGYPTASAYTASKGAVIQLTRTLAAEWAKYGVRVNAIAPGFFRTPMNAGVLASEAALKTSIDKIPLNRVGEPEELVGTVIYLASEASRFVTGSILVVDGGELAAGGYTDQIFPFVYDLV